MIIKASAALRNDYAAVSRLAKETEEPIYITKNGEGDLVLMSIDAFEKREQVLKLRLNQQGYRMVICGKHVIIYRKIDRDVFVYHIADTRTEYTRLFC